MLLWFFVFTVLWITVFVQTNLRIIANLRCSLTSTREGTSGNCRAASYKNRKFKNLFYWQSETLVWSRADSFRVFFQRDSSKHSACLSHQNCWCKELNLKCCHVHRLMKVCRSHKLESSVLAQSLDRLKGNTGEVPWRGVYCRILNTQNHICLRK